MWNRRYKRAGLLLLITVILAACSSSTAEREADRVERIFNLEKSEGKLSIRYFFLDGENLAGDSILIVSPDGHKLLIDAGLPEAGTQVTGYLDRLGIDSLDVALNTHPHIDHLGGFADVAGAVKIGTYYMINLPYTKSSHYRRTIEAMETAGVEMKTLEYGDQFKLGSDVHIEVLSPPRDVLPDEVKTFSSQEINDYSMVMRVTYGERSFLFTGDVYKRREVELVSLLGEQLQSDVLDLAHHGNEGTSSSTMFLQAVKPSIVLASQNIFQSPNLKERLEKTGAKMYSTGLHGNLLIESDGKEIEVITEKDWLPPDRTKSK